ncbi:MAG: MMPL family transporter [Deltaproteobacteria bacterium]|nr:MMPL family transporter [Deltaproteobacteria bacterium]
MNPPSLLSNLALLVRRRYRIVFAGLLISLLLAGLGILRLRFDTDVMNLLPQEEPVFKVFRETMQEFGSFDNLLVALELPEGVVLDPYLEAVEELGTSLEGMPELESVSFRIEEPEELLRQLFPGAVFFLDGAGRQAFEDRLSDEGIETRIREVRRTLLTPQAVALRQLLKLDPLGLSEILLGQVDGSRGSLEVDWTSGFYLSQDQRLLLILAKPVERPQNIAFDRRLVAGVEQRFAEIATRWPELAGEDLPVPKLVLGGSYLTALDDASFIQSDMMRNTATSVVGVLLLFFIAFRRLSALFYALLPLTVGLVLTFGFAGAFLGTLSNATSGVAALLIGLGIDFVIVVYGRYVAERRRGGSLEQALSLAFGSSGRAVVVGAVTTAATFGAFLLTDFPGLREMGLLTGVGILFCMVAVLVLLPALLSWSEDRHRRRKSTPNLYLHGFGTGFLIRGSLARPWPILFIGCAVTVLALLKVGDIRFEESMSAMRPKENRGLEGAAKVAQHFGGGFDFTMLVLTGDSPEDVLALAGRASDLAQGLVEEEIIAGFQSVTSVLPPLNRQRETLSWLETGRQDALDPQRIEATVRRVLAEEGMRAKAFEEGLSLLRTALQRHQTIGVEEVSSSDQGARFLDQFLRSTDDGWKTVLRLYPPDNRWRKSVPPEIDAMAEALGPQAIVAGSNRVNERVKQIVQRDAIIAVVTGFLLVALLIWVDFRSLRDTALALTPLAVGIVWMLGFMAAVGIKANFMNVFVSTMIIGIGVDYGLHMIHRYREIEATGGDLTAGLEETGRAIVIAALSTIVGFGSLSLSHYPGLKTTGYVAIMGAVATAWVSITLVPALLALGNSSKRSHPP